MFAPVALETTNYHYWYYRPYAGQPFADAHRIPPKISGGREGGYRAYTFKEGIDPGDWRVDVEAEDGRVIGRVAVKVLNKTTVGPLSLTTVVY